MRTAELLPRLNRCIAATGSVFDCSTQQALLQRFRHRFRFRMDLQLRVDILNVEIDGADSDAEGGGGLVAVALHQQLEKPHFMRCQLVRGVGRRPKIPKKLDHTQSDLRRHGGAARRGFPDAFQQFSRRRLLGQRVAWRSGGPAEDVCEIRSSSDHQNR